MLRTLIFLLVMAVPTAIFAKNTEPVKVYFGEYDALSKKFSTYTSIILSMKFSRYIHQREMFNLADLLEKQLSKNGKEIIKVRNRADADYHVIFMQTPPFYNTIESNGKVRIPDLNPNLPTNKHAKNSKPYRFTSPWIRGTLYIKDDKPVGGSIIVQMSKLRRAKELYYISEQNWDSIPIGDNNLLGELTIPQIKARKVVVEYRDKFKKFESKIRREVSKYRKLYGGSTDAEEKCKKDSECFSKIICNESGKCFSKISKKDFANRFTPQGDTALFIAHLARISSHSEGRILYNYKLRKCLERSEDFYSKLHAHLFRKLFKQDNYSIELPHDITPSRDVFQALNDESGNYNCFIRKPRETT